MAQTLLEVRNLRVDYEDLTAVDDVSFSVEAGMVYGLIGPNGAGKTSTIRAISTLVEPTYGEVFIGGTDVELEPSIALARLGYMPDFPPVYEDLKLWEFLDLFASAYRVPKETRQQRIDALLDQVKLLDRRDSLAGEMSRGMKQRLFLAKTLLHEPDVLVLDEPASGLDPLARKDLIAVLRNLGDAGKAVLVSSHILAEMDQFCNAVGIMQNGQMKVSGRIEDILANMAQQQVISMELAHPSDGLAVFLNAQDGVSNLTQDSIRFHFEFQGDSSARAALLQHMIQAGHAVCEFRLKTTDLNEIFEAVAGGTEQ